ncbi:PAS domain S-box protein [bacterium]|nr:PAS domain S-box protein [bacterium]
METSGDKPSISIKTAFSISVIGLVLFISLSFCVFFLRLHKNTTDHYMRSKSSFAIRILSTEAAPHIIKHETDYIRWHVSSLISDQDILYAAIYTPKGEVIAEAYQNCSTSLPSIDIAGIHETGPSFSLLKDRHGRQTGYDVSMRITSQNEWIGTSRIIVSFKDAEKGLAHIRRKIIILLALITLLGATIGIIISSFITKPILNLVKAEDRIAKGDFMVNVPIQSRTEIGMLAKSFNNMVLNIHRYRDRIINQSNELKAVIDSMGSGLFTVDKEWKITSFNKAAEKITGYRAEEVIGKTCEQVFQSEACHTECPLESSLKEGSSILSNDFCIKGKNTSKIPISASTSPLKNEAGEIIGGVEVFKDLTEVKELQKQLIQADKMAALGQMISGIAHDINNPTGVIHSNIISLSEYISVIKELFLKYRGLAQNPSIFKDQSILDTFSDIREYEEHHDIDYIMEDLYCLVEESKEAAGRITHIIKDLRDFIHIDVGQLQLADLNQRLDVSLNLVKFDTNIKVIKEYAPIPPVYINVQQIDQVFTNIILNAVQALGNRGEIRIKTSLADDSHVKVAIKDNGPGISEDIISKVFDPFFTTKEIGQGTGLGLSICYKVVSKHEGKIWVESEPGKGAEFFIELPVNFRH